MGKKISGKTIGLIIVAILIIGAIFYLESMKVKPASDISEVSGVEEEVNAETKWDSSKDKLYTRAPELSGIAGYINTDENLRIYNLRGKVVLIDFWTYSCINCIRTLPYLTGWDEKYRDKGLVIIGVHTPEFNFEKEYNNVKNAVEKYGIKYAVVQDNDYQTWRAYNNHYWPRKYLIDEDGYIRYDHIGEGAYAETELKIQELLEELGEEVNEGVGEDEVGIIMPITPELYAGYDFALPRGQNIGNEGGLLSDESVDYIIPNEIARDKIYLGGRWKSNSDNLELVGEQGSVVLNFIAKEVNIVANSEQNQEIEVLINNKYISNEQKGYDVEFNGERAIVKVQKPQLYNIFDGEYGNYRLELRVGKGFKFNAFTFG